MTRQVEENWYRPPSSTEEPRPGWSLGLDVNGNERVSPWSDASLPPQRWQRTRVRRVWIALAVLAVVALLVAIAGVVWAVRAHASVEVGISASSVDQARTRAIERPDRAAPPSREPMAPFARWGVRA